MTKEQKPTPRKTPLEILNSLLEQGFVVTKPAHDGFVTIQKTTGNGNVHTITINVSQSVIVKK